jgi:hypothetical protein
MATEPPLSTHDIKVIDFGAGLDRKSSLRKRVWVRFWNPRARRTRRAALMGWMEEFEFEFEKRKEVELRGTRGRRGLQLTYTISREISGEESEEEFQRIRFIFNGQFIAFKKIRPSRTSTNYGMAVVEQVHRDGYLIARTQHDTTAILNNRESAFRNLSPPRLSLWPQAHIGDASCDLGISSHSKNTLSDDLNLSAQHSCCQRL